MKEFSHLLFINKGETLMKFIHTGDLHLDSPFRGLMDIPPSLWEKIHASTFAAFKQIVDDAIRINVDFVLIAGDIYDRKQHSIAAEDFFISQCQRLADHHIPVYLLYGNHDYRLVEAEDDLPANVHVFGNRVTTTTFELRNHDRVAISGFSYHQRWIDDDVLPYYPARQNNVTWHIGMLHGAVREAKTDHYAPFTIAELQEKGYDYWALGHIHKHQLLSSTPPIVYCGNPQGRHKNEGGQHGYYLVESRGNKLVPTFQATSKIQWCRVELALPAVHNLRELEMQISKAIDNTPLSAGLQLVALTITQEDHLPVSLRQLLVNGAVLEQLQKKFTGSSKWWLYEINLTTPAVMPSLTDLDHEYWQQAANDVFTTDSLLQLASSLTREDFLAERLAAADPADFKDKVMRLLGQGEVPNDY